MPTGATLFVEFEKGEGEGLTCSKLWRDPACGLQTTIVLQGFMGYHDEKPRQEEHSQMFVARLTLLAFMKFGAGAVKKQA